MMTPDTPVEKIKNIGPKSAQWLRQIGIETFADLQNNGALLTYKILQHHFKNINIVMLYALEGALLDRHWNSFSAEEKAAMKSAASEPLQISFDQD